MSSTPNFVLNKDYEYTCGSFYDKKILTSGTFVRPIEFQYVPTHIVSDPRWRGFNKLKEVFCYTSQGIVPIPSEYIRKL